eukprot:TRINITY_DN4199_c0_g1_i1.p1 TRINITY_DN4199_c0_g1~~TRINITY_DN4199_c0_g1_i1.p1  ORF type:complete len:263 (-),score=12.90 TRINITY_DN4199_c0_g1_i1:319-1107(-)
MEQTTSILNGTQNPHRGRIAPTSSVTGCCLALLLLVFASSSFASSLVNIGVERNVERGTCCIHPAMSSLHEVKDSVFTLDLAMRSIPAGKLKEFTDDVGYYLGVGNFNSKDVIRHIITLALVMWCSEQPKALPGQYRQEVRGRLPNVNADYIGQQLSGDAFDPYTMAGKWVNELRYSWMVTKTSPDIFGTFGASDIVQVLMNVNHLRAGYVSRLQSTSSKYQPIAGSDLYTPQLPYCHESDYISLDTGRIIVVHLAFLEKYA